MHEISLMTNILEITIQEMRKHNTEKLLAIHVRCGGLSNVVPDSMRFAFEALTKGSIFEGAILHLNVEALSLECTVCKHVFESQRRDYIDMPCPSCTENVSFKVLAGDGIFLDRLEAE